MGNIIGYLQKHGHETFNERPLGEVDALIFAQLSYINWSGIVTGSFRPEDGCRIDTVIGMGKEEQLAESSFFGLQDLSLISVCAMTKRFAGIKMFAYRERYNRKTHMQFAAVSYVLPDGEICVAFRGTDETVIGWQESCSMVYRFPIPAQEFALQYLENVLETNPGKGIVVAGHSKGGNVSVYAASECRKEMRSLIRYVYNFDGPGFPSEFYRRETYLTMKERIGKYVVPESFVGIFMKHTGPVHMIDSKGVGVKQHDLFQWEVTDISIKRAEVYNTEKRKKGKALNERIMKLPKDDARKLLDSFFAVLNKRGIQDVTKIKMKDTLVLIRSTVKGKNYNKEGVKILGSVLMYFVSCKFPQKKL